MLPGIVQGEQAGDAGYQKWADAEPDPEVARLLRLNGREETLHGERVKGRYHLFHIGGRDGNDWMIRRVDPPQDPDREPMPEHVAVLIPVPGPLPVGVTVTFGFSARVRLDAFAGSSEAFQALREPGGPNP